MDFAFVGMCGEYDDEYDDDGGDDDGDDDDGGGGGGGGDGSKSLAIMMEQSGVSSDLKQALRQKSMPLCVEGI